MWLEISGEAGWLSCIIFCTERLKYINTWNCYPSAVLTFQIKTVKKIPGLDLSLKILEWDLGLPGAFLGGMCSRKTETGPGTLAAQYTQAGAWVPDTN